MLILALDTTSETGGVGVFHDAERLVWVPNENPANRYSVTLFEMVEKAQVLAGMQLGHVELFAAANGPGSFTGIRVGLAAARAWGTAFHRRVRGVSVLEAMVSKAPASSDWVFPILDARRGEFYLGSFRRRPSEPLGSTKPDYEAADAGWVLKPESICQFVEERLANSASATCIVRVHDQAAQNLRSSLPATLGWQGIEGALVDAIAAIALRQERGNEPFRESNLDACYIRRPDAEINWKD